MAEILTPLEADKYYHIYNHAVGAEKLFDNSTDYLYFLDKFKKYVSPFCDVLAYCLIPNHFHFVICINDEKRILDYLTKNKLKENVNVSEVLSKAFSDFFNTYAKWYNFTKKRRGTLFTRAFRRKQIIDNTYLQNLIVYIHQNPVKAGFCLKPDGWKYSSYNALMGDADTMLRRDEVMGLFENRENFIFCNGKVVDMDFG